MAKTEIKPDMLVSDLVADYPFAISILAKGNLHCIVCGEPVWGTLEELATDKHLSVNQLNELIKEIKVLAQNS